jgi:hypothetical protein
VSFPASGPLTVAALSAGSPVYVAVVSRLMTGARLERGFWGATVLTLVGAVSPPGGDFPEPVVQTSLRVAGGFWGLDANLAYRRHYPAINWNISYSLYLESLDPWFEQNAPKGWIENRQKTFSRAKTYLVSTPTMAGASRIDMQYQRSDRRRYHVPCPHCQTLQHLEFGGKDRAHGLKWRVAPPLEGDDANSVAQQTLFQSAC